MTLNESQSSARKFAANQINPLEKLTNQNIAGTKYLSVFSTTETSTYFETNFLSPPPTSSAPRFEAKNAPPSQGKRNKPRVFLKITHKE